VGHDVDGRDLGVEGIGVFEIVVPDLINDVAEKFGDATLGRFVTGVVIEAGFMGRLCTNPAMFLSLRGRRMGRTNVLLPCSASYLAASVRMAVREWIPFN